MEREGEREGRERERQRSKIASENEIVRIDGTERERKERREKKRDLVNL